jgi:hypothetical protein
MKIIKHILAAVLVVAVVPAFAGGAPDAHRETTLGKPRLSIPVEASQSSVSPGVYRVDLTATADRAGEAIGLQVRPYRGLTAAVDEQRRDGGVAVGDTVGLSVQATLDPGATHGYLHVRVEFVDAGGKSQVRNETIRVGQGGGTSGAGLQKPSTRQSVPTPASRSLDDRPVKVMNP